MDPLKFSKSQFENFALDQKTIDQIEKVSDNQLHEACDLILQNVPQEKAIDFRYT